MTNKVTIGSSGQLAVHGVMTLGFILMHGQYEVKLRRSYTLIKLQGVSMGSVVARGPIDKLKLPAILLRLPHQ